MEFLRGHFPASDNAIVLMIGVGALIFFAWIVTNIFRFATKHSYHQIFLRIYSWMGIWLTLVGFSALGRFGTVLLFAMLSAVALWEFFRLVPREDMDRRVIILAYLVIPIQFWFVYHDWFYLFITFIPIFVQFIIASVLVIAQRSKGFLSILGIAFWGITVNIFCISHIAGLINLDNPSTPVVESIDLLLFLIVASQLNDVAQFLSGKAFGRHKILPRISPNKTWEGLVGGILLSMLVSYGLNTWLFSYVNASTSILLGILISLSGFFGDAIMSAVKRDIGVKDFSQMIPGHGGVLDRIDGIMFAAPIFYHLNKIFS